MLCQIERERGTKREEGKRERERHTFVELQDRLDGDAHGRCNAGRRVVILRNVDLPKAQDLHHQGELLQKVEQRDGRTISSGRVFQIIRFRTGNWSLSFRN